MASDMGPTPPSGAPLQVEEHRAARLGISDFLVPLGTLGTLAVNGLANSVQIGGETTGSVSGAFPTLITPAGYAFGIWGVIYLGLLTFSLHAMRPSIRSLPRWPLVRGLYLWSCLLNCLWIFVWHHRLMTLSSVVIAALLGSLLAIYRLLDADRIGAGTRERLLLLLPFSLYASWVTVATVVNVAVSLTALGFSGGAPGPTAWAVGILLVTAVLSMVTAIPRRDGAWLLVAAWAFGAIAVASDGDPWVRGTAAFLVITMVSGAILAWMRRGRGRLRRRGGR